VSIINSSRLETLEASINQYLNAGEKCQKYISNYNGNILVFGDPFVRAQTESREHFKIIFESLSQNTTDLWKTEKQVIEAQVTALQDDKQITLYPHNERLSAIKDKILQCEKINTFFKESIGYFFRKRPEILIDTAKKGKLFGLENPDAEISECHCCDLMNRKRRAQFTMLLNFNIKEIFPEKKEITVASIGAGSFFHELEIHHTLTALGYKIDWVLNDLKVSRPKIDSFSLIVGWNSPNSTITSFEGTGQKYLEQVNQTPLVQPDVFLFIDLDGVISKQTQQFYGSKMTNICIFSEFKKEADINDASVFTVYPTKI